MDENKTPQEIAIDAITDDLKTMENMVNFFASKKYEKNIPQLHVALNDKYAKMMRKLINEKTAELQRAQNHYDKRQEKDAREEYIIQVENENKRLTTENHRLQVIINTNVAKDEK